MHTKRFDGKSEEVLSLKWAHDYVIMCHSVLMSIYDYKMYLPRVADYYLLKKILLSTCIIYLFHKCYNIFPSYG